MDRSAVACGVMRVMRVIGVMGVMAKVAVTLMFAVTFASVLGFLVLVSLQ